MLAAEQLWHAAAGDASPDAFTVADQTGLAPSATASGSLVPTGFDMPVLAAITGGGQVSNDNATWAASASINPGQTVYWRVTAPAAYSDVAAFTLSVGDKSDGFTVATRIDPYGQAIFTHSGYHVSNVTSHSFTVPLGVTSICALAVAPGAPGSQDNSTANQRQGGAGGANQWANAIAVTPGEVLTIEFVRGTTAAIVLGTPFSVASFTMARLKRAGGTYIIAASAGKGVKTARGDRFANAGQYSGSAGGGLGGLGTSSTSANWPGGGGAAGYSGNGGDGEDDVQPRSNGAGGGGAGAALSSISGTAVKGGGGVGLFGEGASGASDAAGGSSGQAGTVSKGGDYGGGSQGSNGATGPALHAGAGAVRIIWGAGAGTRSFPSNAGQP